MLRMPPLQHDLAGAHPIKSHHAGEMCCCSGLSMTGNIADPVHDVKAGMHLAIHMGVCRCHGERYRASLC